MTLGKRGDNQLDLTHGLSWAKLAGGLGEHLPAGSHFRRNFDGSLDPPGDGLIVDDHACLGFAGFDNGQRLGVQFLHLGDELFPPVLHGFAAETGPGLQRGYVDFAADRRSPVASGEPGLFQEGFLGLPARFAPDKGLPPTRLLARFDGWPDDDIHATILNLKGDNRA